MAVNDELAADAGGTGGYIGLEVETDPDEIAQEAFDYLSIWIEGWEPAEGNLETILIEGNAQEQSVERSLASQTTDDIFRRYGWATGILPREETAATGTTTWTALDDDGHLIPAGTQMTLSTDVSGDPIGFQTVIDYEIAAGAASISGVLIEAIEPGEEGSGLSQVVELVDALAWEPQVTVEGVTTGGQTAEETEDYMVRLTRRLQVREGALVLPRDYEVMAREHPLVARALALDNYNAQTQQWDQPRSVTVAVVDETGEVLPQGVKDEIDAQFQARREVNFEVFVIDATYTSVAVQYVGVVLPGFDPEVVRTAVNGALATYLSPGNWGFPPLSDPGVTPGDWIEQRVVRWQDVSAMMQYVAGFDYHTSLLINGGTEDIQLTGVAPLVRAGAIDGTMHLPT